MVGWDTVAFGAIVLAAIGVVVGMVRSYAKGKQAEVRDEVWESEEEARQDEFEQSEEWDADGGLDGAVDDVLRDTPKK